MSADVVYVTGELPEIRPEDAKRIAVYLVRGNQILTQQPASADGSVRLALSRNQLTEDSAYGLEVVVGPAGMRKQLRAAPQLQRVALPSLPEIEGSQIAVAVDRISLTDEIFEPWWEWCEWYCITGQVIGPDGCPVPFAQVTVNSVDFGLSKSPLVTVTTDANGNFTACFNWCDDECWPCWPFWWLCWPWWWEVDLLHVIDHVEQALPVPHVGPGPVGFKRPTLAIRQPDSKALVRGEGFAAARQMARVEPDEARTALIRRKLSNPAIQRIFPWWWWCNDDPNICFTVTQGGNVVLNEDPAFDTRWGVEEGDSFTLVAGGNVVTHCGGDPKPLHGFVWSRVGYTSVANIHQGYADGSPGTAYSDLAFWGDLDIYGEFAPASNVAYYQVDADHWTGDPARGGSAPGAPTPIATSLTNSLGVWHHLTNVVTFHDVLMGPFDDPGSGLTNLYATQEQRHLVPVTRLPPFPPNVAGDFVFWQYEGRKVYADAAAIAGTSSGAVTLTVTGYNSAFVSQPLTHNTDDALILLVDDTNLVTTTHINYLKAYDHLNVEVTSTGAGACPAYDIGRAGPGGYVVLNVTVKDTKEHIALYGISPDFGHGSTGTTTPGQRNYQPPGDPFPALPYKPPTLVGKSFGGGTEDIYFYPTVNCCYDFRLYVAKRVTNGSGSPGEYTADFQTATIKVN